MSVRVRPHSGRTRGRKPRWLLHQGWLEAQGFEICEYGEVSERSKEHAWKACIRVTPVSRVRIPPSPPVLNLCFCFGRDSSLACQISHSAKVAGQKASTGTAAHVLSSPGEKMATARLRGDGGPG